MKRKFLTVNGNSSDARPTTYSSDARVVYVAEVVDNMKSTLLDEDHVAVSERDAVREVVSDLYLPMYCCRGPERKLPPQSPVDALRLAAARARDGLRPGQIVELDGESITL